MVTKIPTSGVGRARLPGTAASRDTVNIMNLKRNPLLAALLLVVALLALALAACGGDDDDGDDGDSNTAASYMGAEISEPVDMPQAVLTDQDGKPFDLKAESKGHVTLLYVGYTHCPDICPTHLYEISEALKRVPADVRENVKVVFVTADPERDNPAALKSYLTTFDPTFVGLTGTREQTDKFQADLGIPVATRTDLGGGNYTVNHAAYVIAYTKDQVAYTVYPSGMGMKEWTNDLPLLVKKGYKP